VDCAPLDLMATMGDAEQDFGGPGGGDERIVARGNIVFWRRPNGRIRTATSPPTPDPDNDGVGTQLVHRILLLRFLS
jgi:hypothetical protein